MMLKHDLLHRIMCGMMMAAEQPGVILQETSFILLVYIYMKDSLH